MFCVLSEVFGWTPAEIGQLTPEQAVAYCRHVQRDPREDAGGHIKFDTLEEANAYIEANKGRRRGCR